MPNISQLIYRASQDRNITNYPLMQQPVRDRVDFPFGDVAKIKAYLENKGHLVTQCSDENMLVDYSAWVNYAGVVRKFVTQVL